MQMTTEARAWLDATVRRILARHPLGDPERMAITYELMSHLHAGGESEASQAGRTEVSRSDLEAALAKAGGEAALATAFVAPLARPVERVLFWRRAGAFAIDALLVGIATSFVHTVVTFLLGPLLPGPAAGFHMSDLVWVLPWGFHDLGVSALLQLVIAIASAAVVLGYFVLFEVHDGRTPGKRALGIRVARVDGEPLSAKDALVRNVAKLAPALLLLDVVIMLLAFQKEKQRVSDRIAGTVVLRA